MGNRPSLDFSLDRIDNDKGYNKDNCKWSNYETQNRNRRVFKTNKTGYTGISKDKSSGKYKVGIEYKLNGKRKSVNLGSYKNISDAILARKEGEKKYWGRK